MTSTVFRIGGDLRVRRLGFVLEGEQDFEYPKGHPIRANAWRYALSPLRQASSGTEGA